jgi:hypothetical protein
MINNEDPTDTKNLALQDGVFIDTTYLTQFPLVDLVSVLTYFSTTPFFHPVSSNYTLHRQNLPPVMEHLQQMVGREYVVEENLSKPPHLWIIKEQHRYGIDKVEMLQMFFILDGQVMRCTNLKEILVTRFQKIAFALQKVHEEFSLL